MPRCDLNNRAGILYGGISYPWCKSSLRTPHPLLKSFLARPVHSCDELKASNLNDVQAANENQMGLWGCLMAGATVVIHAAGWLEGGLSVSYEKIITDVEVLNMVAELCAGKEAGADEIGFENALSWAMAATRVSAASVISSTLVPLTAKVSPVPPPRMFRLFGEIAKTCTPGTDESFPLIGPISSCCDQSRSAQSGRRATMNAVVPLPIPMML